MLVMRSTAHRNEVLTLKSSGTLSSLLRGAPPKRRSWSFAELLSAWYEGGAWVYWRCASGSSCGAGEYFVVLAMVIWSCDERGGLFACSGIGRRDVGSAPLEVQEENDGALASE